MFNLQSIPTNLGTPRSKYLLMLELDPTVRQTTPFPLSKAFTCPSAAASLVHINGSNTEQFLVMGQRVYICIFFFGMD
ncbi:hypothetical protein GDO86_016314 [Hymenochirus boettgeri]|uniref:Uncharacterized protein n=1 Tax=Hymenochirus boettgeri TaxID=247094 RepID=A0A8T2K4Y9_9PIPI|nr:hypothetical protein GDO86_016314 [Hymenochirus boettgeri]